MNEGGSLCPQSSGERRGSWIHMAPSGSLLTITVKKNHLRRPFYPGRSPGIGQQNSWFKLCFSLSLSAQESSLVGLSQSGLPLFCGSCQGSNWDISSSGPCNPFESYKALWSCSRNPLPWPQWAPFQSLGQLLIPTCKLGRHIPLILYRHQCNLRELNSVFSFPDHRAPAILLWCAHL